MTIVKRYMFYDTNNKYIEDNKKICNELALEIKKNKSQIEKNITLLTKELDKQINDSKYNNMVNSILLSK